MNIAKNRRDDLEDKTEEMSLNVQQRQRGRKYEKQVRRQVEQVQNTSDRVENSVANAASYLPNIHSLCLPYQQNPNFVYSDNTFPNLPYKRRSWCDVSESLLGISGKIILP